MTKPRITQIDQQQAAYLKLLIVDRNADSRKLALETISKLYRSGARFRNPGEILPHILYLCQDEHDKVRRWAFNALALVGSKQDVPTIIAALDREVGNPDILAAVIVALSALASEEQTRSVLKRANFPLEGFALLAAAQQNAVFSRELTKTRIDIDKAGVSELRLATLLLGLRKAPEHMLSERHPNSSVIGELNFHPDELVSQYSVWAAFEDRQMSIDSLRIKPKDFGEYHSGIRKYGYRLMSATSAIARKNREYILEATADTSREAREGLATGLRHTYFKGLEEITLSWFVDEDTETVRSRLLEHMAATADRCVRYERPVLISYAGLREGSLGRARISAAAAGKDIYQELRRIDYESGTADMFAQRDIQDRASAVNLDLNPEDAKVLIVTALEKEAAAVSATLDRSVTIGVLGDLAIYRVGQFIAKSGEKRTIMTVNAGMGKAHASALGANALRSFPNIKYIVMVGIAGGCPNPGDPEKHVRLGDIVVSKADAGVLEYDFIKNAHEVELRRYPQPVCAAMSAAMGELIIQSIAGLRPWEECADQIAVKLGPTFGYPGADKDQLYDGENVVAHPHEPTRREGRPKIIQGLIASADILQKNAADRDSLRDKYQVRAIEMEASGLQTAAWANGKNIYVVRGICDYCDTHKDDVWQDYAAAGAASMARVLVEAMPLAWF